uniref:RAP domain-containing protein n=1 Tax=Echeneis naucrates TaxID=173247 RepID=A0A665V613_ECHNA
MQPINSVCVCVLAACRSSSACVPVHRILIRSSPVRRIPNLDSASAGVRCLHGVRMDTAVVRQVSAAPPPGPLLPPDRRPEERTVRSGSAADLSPYSRYSRSQSGPALLHILSLCEGGVMSELCSRPAGLPSADRAEELASLLRACVELGLEAHSPPVLRLMGECRELGVVQLCHLAQVAHGLVGRRSVLVSEILGHICAAVEEDTVSPSEAVAVYSLLALCYDPANHQQALMLSTLHRHTQRMVHRLEPSQISSILQSLLKYQQSQAASLLLRLSDRASQAFKAFSDDDVMKVLSALMILGQHHEELLAAMEKHLPGVIQSEIHVTVMEYCLLMKCRSEPIFEAVAENFVSHAERHTTLQIAKQIVAMGRLNYLPQCSSQMFKKLESILSTRFSQFQPRSLIEVLHACIHLERFPLNYMVKVFSPYFLQRLQGEPLDNKALGQLTQLHLSTSLECKYYRGPRLPHFLQVKTFSSVDQAFETPMDSILYRHVKGPLTSLLGGKFYSTKIFTPTGYTIDVEICLDEEGYVLPLYQWDHTYRRVALCLDGRSRFCSNTQHLLGKEATKRRHLRRMGYEVVQIPYFEFEKLRTQKEQVKYLQNKIFPTIFKFNHRAQSHQNLRL